MRRGPLFFSCALAAASCGADQKPTPIPTTTEPVAAPTEDPCTLSRAARDRVPGLLAEGRLGRAANVIRRANYLCFESAALTWPEEMDTLAALGRWLDVQRLAERIASDANAPAAARDAAKRAIERLLAVGSPSKGDEATKAPARAAMKDAVARERAGDLEGAYARYLEAWDRFRPNGGALVRAGLVALALGKRVDAQRLLDRGMEELEGVAGDTFMLDPENGLRDPGNVVWGANGKVAIENKKSVSVRDTTAPRGLQTEVQRFEVGELVDASAFSTDGAQIAIGITESVLVMDASSGSIVAQLRAPGRLRSLAFSPDGTSLFAGLSDVWAWDTSDLRKGTANVAARVFPIGAEATYAVELSPDGKLLAASASDRTVHLWELATGKELRKLEGQTPGVLAFSKEGSALLTGTDDGALHAWRISGQGEVGRFEGDGAPLASISRAPDGRIVTLGAKELAIIDVARGKRTVIAPLASRGRRVAVSPDGASIVATFDDRSVRQWDAARGSEIAAVRPHAADVIASVVSATNERVATSDAQGSIFLWGNDGSFRRVAGDAPVDRLRLSADGSVLLGARGASARVWDARAGTAVSTSPATLAFDPITAIDLAPDGKFVAARVGGKLTVWDFAGGDLRTLDGELGPLTSLLFSPDGHALASAGEDRILRIWSVDGARANATRTFDEPVSVLAFSPDQRGVLVGVGDRALALDAATAVDRRSYGPVTGLPRAGAFSKPAETVAVFGDGDVALFDAWSGAERITSDAPRVGLHTARFDAGGALWAIGFEGASGVLLHVQGSNLAGAGAVSPNADVAGIRRMHFRGVAGADGGYAFTDEGFIEFFGARADDARAFPICRLANLSLPFAVCRERFESVGLVRKVLAGDETYRDP